MNEEKFTGKAELYKKYRPSYPDAFMDYLFTKVGFTNKSTIADIGSGTGKLAEMLLKRSGFVYGVEPNEDMRSEAVALFANEAHFQSIHAAAEQTSLPNESVDHITVAQAFHWFDQTRFRQECQRILKPHGKVVLVWNRDDSNSDFVQASHALHRKFCPDFQPKDIGTPTEIAERYKDFYNEGTYQYKAFHYDTVFDEDTFIGRNLSSSFTPKKGDKHYEAYVTELKLLYHQYATAEGLVVPSITQSYMGEVK